MEVEFCLTQRGLVEDIATGRAGVGSFPKSQVSQSRDKERHHLLQEEVQAGVEEDYVSRPVELQQQRVWTKWEEVHLEPSKPPCVRKERDTFPPPLHQKRLFSTSPQQLPIGLG